MSRSSKSLTTCPNSRSLLGRELGHIRQATHVPKAPSVVLHRWMPFMVRALLWMFLHHGVARLRWSSKRKARACFRSPETSLISGTCFVPSALSAKSFLTSQDSGLGTAMERGTGLQRVDKTLITHWSATEKKTLPNPKVGQNYHPDIRMKK